MGSSGGIEPPSNKSEIFQDGDWTDIPEAPVISLSDYAVVFNADNFYYFGGNTGSLSSSILGLSAASWTWSIVGKLNFSRHGHGVILVENTFMVLGGEGLYSVDMPNEACLLSSGQFTCTQLSTNLTDYTFTPLLFLVDNAYGNC